VRPKLVQTPQFLSGGYTLASRSSGPKGVFERTTALSERVFVILGRMFKSFSAKPFLSYRLNTFGFQGSDLDPNA
jgi:hypothetical protein